MEPQGIARAGQTVLARLMESQAWYLPAGSVALWGEGWEKGHWPLPALLLERKLSQVPPICHWCLSSCYPRAGAQREWFSVSLCMGSLRETAWDSKSFFHQLNPHWFLQPEVMGSYFLALEPGTGGIGYGVGTPCSWDIPPEFLSTTCGCGTS